MQLAFYHDPQSLIAITIQSENQAQTNQQCNHSQGNGTETHSSDFTDVSAVDCIPFYSKKKGGDKNSKIREFE